ncbi:MAG TPA: NAD(P)H-hydrate dehydratase [Polyangiaceae bacterium]|nr:NAD(P)H-hydrate dehydratase [Polyangiaceae bacterium]
MTAASIRITASLLRQWPLPEPGADGGKEERGCALVVGGSRETPGAALLAAIGVLRAGAGKLQIATSREVAPGMALAVPEARVIGLGSTRRGEIATGACKAIFPEVKRCDAMVVGPGMADASAVVDLLHRAKQRDATLVVDAGGLRFFSGRRVLPAVGRGKTILTPHPGEMANLWGVERSEVVLHPLELARAAAARIGAIVVLKGPSTYIVGPDGKAFHNTEGNIGLGTSGSGDVLSGIIAGLAARGADPLRAAAWGVYLHAKAGDVLARKGGTLGFLARELPAEIPALMARLSGNPRS